MRIKNKEIRRRRHRKEQAIKSAERDLRVQYSGDKKASTPKAASPAAAKPAAPKKTAADNKSATGETKAATPKKSPPKKKAEAEAEAGS